MDATLNGSNPMFADEAADIALLSKDNMTFRMCSNVLWTTSGWFRTLLTLPQAATRTESVDQSPIHLDEPSDVVTGLFETISGIGLPKLDTLEYAEALLNAAEKYDMPGPPAIIRKLVTQPPLILQPLRVYAIAVHWGWHEEIKIATSHTLTLDLCNPDILKQVQESAKQVILTKLGVPLRLPVCKRQRVAPLARSSRYLIFWNVLAACSCGQPLYQARTTLEALATMLKLLEDLVNKIEV
ncbi:unnamed protein product [Somion occarium]|uniref:BTB domain-containing protein n=1 Tax=Somion occarium TaxID=3059160 RepID=A0ABP1DPH0_9APHY